MKRDCSSSDPLDVARYLDLFTTHPRLFEAGIEAMVRARVFVVLGTLAIIASLTMGIDHSLRGPASQALLLFVCAGVGLLVLAYLRLTGRIEIVGNLTAAVGLVALTGGVVIRGGAGAPAQFVYGIIPLVATLLAGWRSGLVWAMVVMAELAVFIVLRYVGVELPVQVPADSREFSDVIMSAVVTVLISALALTFEWYRIRISQARAVADSAREGAERDRRLAEHRAELERAAHLSSVGQLAAVVGHEINNPLTAIITNLDLARQNVDRNTAELLEEALEGTKRVARIAADLAVVARPEASETSVIDLRDPLKAAIDMTANELRHRAPLDPNLGDVDAPIVANRSRLIQVFVNLLIDAAREVDSGASDEHAITVRVVVDDSSVRVLIRHSGNLPSEEMISDEFFAPASPDTTALSLRVSRHILEGFGASLELFEAESTYIVSFPIAPSVDSPGPVNQQRESLLPIARVRILVIDDEPMVLRSIQRLLHDHETSVATSASEAERALRESDSIDVVLCDVMMPEVSGADMYERLVHLRPELERRFVFLTGGMFDDAVARRIEALDLPVVKKPWTRAELIGAIESAVRESDTIPPQPP